MATIGITCASCRSRFVFSPARRVYAYEQALQAARDYGWVDVGNGRFACTEECAAKLAKDITPTVQHLPAPSQE